MTVIEIKTSFKWIRFILLYLTATRAIVCYLRELVLVSGPINTSRLWGIESRYWDISWYYDARSQLFPTKSIRVEADFSKFLHFFTNFLSRTWLLFDLWVYLIPLEFCKPVLIATSPVLVNFIVIFMCSLFFIGANIYFFSGQKSTDLIIGLDLNYNNYLSRATV